MNIPKFDTSDWPFIIGRNLLMFLLFLTVIELFGSCRSHKSIQTKEETGITTSRTTDLQITEALSDSTLASLQLDFDTLEIIAPTKQIRIRAVKGRVSHQRNSIKQQQRVTRRADSAQTAASQSRHTEEKTTATPPASPGNLLINMLPMLLITGAAIYLCHRLKNKS